MIVEPDLQAFGKGLASFSFSWLDDARRGRHSASGRTPGLGGELLSGGRVFMPSEARDRNPADPLLLHLRAEAFAAEPLTGEAGSLLGFLAVADDRAFDPLRISAAARN